MLNLLFDFTDQSGLFISSPGIDNVSPLSQSRHWLRLKPANEPAGFDPSTFNPETNTLWEDLGPRGTLYLSQGALGPRANLAIRLAPANPATVPLAGLTLQLVISFGHPDIAARTHFASPFTDNGTAPPASGTGGTGSVQTTFTLAPGAHNTVAGWYFPLTRVSAPNVQNAVAIAPADVNVTDRYEFSLGAVVTQSATGIIRNFGEDPEMDIGQ